ncbi:MAG: sulfotransferase domain-containing protein [Pseudomonadota bacterium]
MTRPLLKVIGERNTGTNYLDSLLEKNLNVELLDGEVPNTLGRIIKGLLFREMFRDIYFSVSSSRNLGWKHRFAPDPDEVDAFKTRIARDVHLIILVKNPYSWLLSMHKRPYHQKRSIYKKISREKETLNEFLLLPWPTVRRERGRSKYANIVELLNFKLKSYIELAQSSHATIVRYEDLLKNPEQEITALRKKLNLTTTTNSFVNIEGSTKGDARSFEDIQHYYLEEAWRTKLDNRSLALINSHLEEEDLSKLGYQMISNL